VIAVTVMASERNPSEKTFYHRAIQTKIGQTLRMEYDRDQSAQALPHRLFTILLRMDEEQNDGRLEHCEGADPDLLAGH
jgi:hypothetical protein